MNVPKQFDTYEGALLLYHNPEKQDIPFFFPVINPLSGAVALDFLKELDLLEEQTLAFISIDSDDLSFVLQLRFLGPSYAKYRTQRKIFTVVESEQNLLIFRGGDWVIWQSEEGLDVFTYGQENISTRVERDIQTSPDEEIFPGNPLHTRDFLN